MWQILKRLWVERGPGAQARTRARIALEKKRAAAAQTRLFISYSSKDRSFVEAIVAVLRVTGVTVFLDADSIPLGTNWKVEINTSIDNADICVVFWSENASLSSEVKSEYERAIELGKLVVPVLLSECPLPANLSRYQGVPLVRRPDWIGGPELDDCYAIAVLEAVYGLQLGSPLMVHWPSWKAHSRALLGARLERRPLEPAEALVLGSERYSNAVASEVHL